jgi:Undecaprenyl-phosphate galactose phosphotransferase WbaP
MGASRFRPIFIAASKEISGHLTRSHLRLAVDLASFFLASALAYKLIEISLNVFDGAYVSWSRIIDERGAAFALTSLIVVAWLYLKGDYHQKLPFWDSTKNLVYGCLVALLIEGFILYANKSDVSRLLTFITWMIAPLIAMFGRALERRISHARGVGLASVLVLGREAPASNAARLVSSDPHLGLTVIGRVDPDDVEDVETLLSSHPNLNYVLVAMSGSDEVENRLIQQLRTLGVDLIIVPVSNGIASGMEVRYLLGEESILLIDKMEVIPRLNRFAKRVFDVVVSALILSVVGLPMLAVAWIVRRDGGPATFLHERVGQGGSRFKCIKFRSMATNADELLRAYLVSSEENRRAWEKSRKLKDDPRVTPFGRFIRKTTIDELPQLINVLRGEMSLVGPRPVTQGELDYYGNTVSFYTSVRPGLTGLWQVSGRSDLSYEQRVRLDTWYVRNWTPWHDVAILLKTVPAVLFRKGAY